MKTNMHTTNYLLSNEKIKIFKTKITEFNELLQKHDEIVHQTEQLEKEINQFNNYYRKAYISIETQKTHDEHLKAKSTLDLKLKEVFSKIYESDWFNHLNNIEDFQKAKKKLARKQIVSLNTDTTNHKNIPVGDYQKLVILEIICAQLFGQILFNQHNISKAVITKEKLKDMQKHAKKLRNNLCSSGESYIFHTPLKQIHLTELLDEFIAFDYKTINVIHSKKNHRLTMRQMFMQKLAQKLIKEGWWRLTNTYIADTSILICSIIMEPMARKDTIELVKKINLKQRQYIQDQMSYIAKLIKDSDLLA